MMCLATPAEVIALGEEEMATVSLGGIKKEISLALVDDVSVGDYVIVHVGFALQKLNVEEAKRTLLLMVEESA